MLLSDVGSLQEETSSQADQDQRGPDELHQETSHPEIVRLQDELQSALNEVKSIEREAEVAKEAAGTELVLMRRQLTSCQAALVEAEQVFSLPKHFASPRAYPLYCGNHMKFLRRVLAVVDQMQRFASRFHQVEWAVGKGTSYAVKGDVFCCCVGAAVFT